MLLGFSDQKITTTKWRSTITFHVKEICQQKLIARTSFTRKNFIKDVTSQYFYFSSSTETNISLAIREEEEGLQLRQLQLYVCE